MTREQLQALIDRVIGKKGILRAPSWWVRRLFEKVIEYGESYTRKAVANAKVIPDTEMSDESTNPVQNRVIKSYIDVNSVTVDTVTSLYSSNAVSNKAITKYVNDKVSVIRKNYLAFTIVGGSAQLSHSKGVSYSLDGGVTWKKCWGFSGVANPPEPIEIPAASTVLFKNVPSSISSDDGTGYFKVTVANGGGVYVHGNIMSLLYGDDFENKVVVPDYAFIDAFKAVPIIGVEKGLLPALKVGSLAYHKLFYGQKNFTEYPDLPATDIGESCYAQMFDFAGGVPMQELCAKNLSYCCYDNMFYNSNITQSPIIYINGNIGQKAFSSMFSASNIRRMREFRVNNWSGFMSVNVELFKRTFANCIYLTEVELPPFSAIDSSNVFVETFQNSHSLRRIKFIVNDNSVIRLDAFKDWVSGVAEEGVFVTTSYVKSILPVGVNGIPEGWTVEVIDDYEDLLPYAVDNLESESTSAALSAKQGKVLAERIGDIDTILDNINGEEV